MTQVTALANNPASKKRIKNGLIEISNALTRAEAEKDLINNIIEDVCLETGLDAKVYRKMARTYHKQNFKQEVEENRAFEDFYETIVENVAVIDNGASND